VWLATLSILVFRTMISTYKLLMVHGEPLQVLMTSALRAMASVGGMEVHKRQWS